MRMDMAALVIRCWELQGANWEGLGVIFFVPSDPKHHHTLSLAYSNIFLDDMGPQHVWPAYITCDAFWLKI